MIQTQTEHTGNRLGAQVLGRRETGLERRLPDVARLGTEAGSGDESCVELPHGDRAIRIVDGQRHAEGREEVRKLALRQRVVGSEVREARGHEPIRDDGCDLRCRPRGGRGTLCAGRSGRADEEEDRAGNESQAAHTEGIGTPSAGPQPSAGR